MRPICVIACLLIFLLPSDAAAQTSVEPCSPTHQRGLANASASYRMLCDPTSCGSRNWFEVGYASYWFDGLRTPPLVTGAPAGTPRATAGVLGNDGTSILSGGNLGDERASGIRLGFGHFLDDCGNVALTGSLLALGGDSARQFPADTDSIISRPFFNVDPAVNAMDAELVNFPGVVSGTIAVANDVDVFSGGVGLQKRLQCCGDRCNARRIDAYLGYRAFAFDESLVISEALTSDAGSGFLPAGTTFDVVDRFETENRFHGVEFGFGHARQRQRWIFAATTRVALGNMHQRVTIDGSTTVTVPGFSPVVQPYGILAGPSNIGVHERDKFGVLSDTRLEIGYQVSCRLKLQLGYNLIFLNDVARPGDFVDLNVNGTLIDPSVADSGPANPAFNWKSESLLLHGLNVGVEFTF